MKEPCYNYILKQTDIQYWETKALVDFGKTYGSNSLWFPNTRQRQCIKRPTNKPFSRRFVFLSRVEKLKGIDVLKDCFSSLPKEYHIDIYGPINDYNTSDLTGQNYSYKQPIEPAKVPEILSQYDVLVLPTLWKTEGYPGIIIEGYGIGIPSIASKIGAIPEIIENGKTGLLIEPGNAEALKQAVLSINTTNYTEMAKNALAAFENFDTEEVNDRILKTVLS